MLGSDNLLMDAMRTALFVKFDYEEINIALFIFSLARDLVVAIPT